MKAGYKQSRNVRLFLVNRTSGFFICLLLSLSAISGCEGDPGPAGPAGPPGSSGTAGLEVHFIGSYPIIRADESSQITLTARVTTANESRVSDIHVSFTISTGSGSLSSTEAVTDLKGEASTIYTAGTTPGYNVIAASITVNGVTLADAALLYLDPITVSLPLLNTSSGRAIQANWSADGTTIIYQTDYEYDARLFKIHIQGGAAAYLGAYRGGTYNPDGSDRIAVIARDYSDYYNAIDTVYVMNGFGELVDGPFYPAGKLRVVGWAYGRAGGDSLVTTYYSTFYVFNLSYATMRSVSTSVSVLAFSPVPGSSSVVASGAYDDYTFDSYGVFLIDLDTGTSNLLVSEKRGSSSYDRSDVRGVSVNNQTGDRFVFSERPETIYGLADDHDLYIMPVTGGERELLLSSPAEELYPQWSPDGQKILFCSDRSGVGYNLYILELNSNP